MYRLQTIFCSKLQKSNFRLRVYTVCFPRGYLFNFPVLKKSPPPFSPPLCKSSLPISESLLRGAGNSHRGAGNSHEGTGNSEKRGTPNLAGGDFFKTGNCHTPLSTLHTSRIGETKKLTNSRIVWLWAFTVHHQCWNGGGGIIQIFILASKNLPILSSKNLPNHRRWTVHRQCLTAGTPRHQGNHAIKCVTVTYKRRPQSTNSTGLSRRNKWNSTTPASMGGESTARTFLFLNQGNCSSISYDVKLRGAQCSTQWTVRIRTMGKPKEICVQCTVYSVWR